MDDTPNPSNGTPGGPNSDRAILNQETMDHWEKVIEDMEATASEYERDGWETLLLHPGDVAVLNGADGAGPGLDVVVPDPEFRDLVAAIDGDVEVEAVDVYRASVASTTFLVIVLEYTGELAVFVPVYYRTAGPKIETALRRAHDDGEFVTRLRRLAGESVIISHEDPSLFAPDPEDDA